MPESDPPPPRVAPDRSTRTSVLPYVLPMGVYLLLSSFEPAAPDPGMPAEPGVFGLTYDQYPLIYTVKLAITAAVLWLCRPAWGQWPLFGPDGKGVSPLAIGVGVGRRRALDRLLRAAARVAPG